MTQFISRPENISRELELARARKAARLAKTNMKSLNDEVKDIMTAKSTKAVKKESLVKLGLTDFDVEVILNMYKPVRAPRRRNAFTFGQLIMHFRLATHGSVKRDNCHPFYDGETGTWFAHNGVLNVRPKRDTTDSETAFRELFVPYIKQYGLNADETRYTIRQVLANTSSKFAFLQGEDLQLFGEYKQLANGGCWYSNLRFMYYMNDYRTRYNITFI